MRMQTFVGQTKIVMVFSKVAYRLETSALGFSMDARVIRDECFNQLKIRNSSINKAKTDTIQPHNEIYATWCSKVT